MKPPRIGLITYAMYGGGMEMFLLRLGKFLAQRGLEVELVTTTEPGPWFARAADFGLAALNIPGWKQGTRVRAVCRAWRVGTWLRRRKYDVVFLNHSPHAGAGIGLLPDKVLVVPIFHNDDEAVYNVGCLSHRRWNIAVGVSPKVVEAVRKRVPDRPVELIPYGIEMPAEECGQKRPRTGGEKLRLIFVGRLDHRQKGVLFLPDILRGCREQGIHLDLTIVGEGPDGSQLAREFSARGLDECVRFAGLLPPERVYACLLESHVLLLPSFYEGLPIALLESLACGCVPVVSRLAGITDYAVEHDVNGITVAVGDVPGFVESIAQLARNPEAWHRMSMAASQTSARRFSVAAMGQAYLKLIESGMKGAYPIPVSRRWRLPVDARLLLGWRTQK